MKLGQYLIKNLNYDFTFLHPETLVTQCNINHGVLSIPESIHYQDYKVLILPGMKALSISVAKKLLEFVKSGGTLVSIAELPLLESEYAKNEELQEIIYELFGTTQVGTVMTINEYGQGKCLTLPYSEIQNMESVLDSIKNDVTVVKKTYGLQYIHKRTDEKDVWYFSAINRNADTDVILDGTFDLKSIDPFTGEEMCVSVNHENDSTVFHLRLGKERSVLIEGTKTC